MKVTAQRWGLLELHGVQGDTMWVSAYGITSVRAAFPEQRQSLITVGPVELQVDHSPAELLEAISSILNHQPLI